MSDKTVSQFEAVADQIRESIPEDTESFQFYYNNPIEKKSVIGDVARVPEVQKAFAAMERNIPLFESVSVIQGLEYDVNVMCLHYLNCLRKLFCTSSIT